MVPFLLQCLISQPVPVVSWGLPHDQLTEEERLGPGWHVVLLGMQTLPGGDSAAQQPILGMFPMDSGEGKSPPLGRTSYGAPGH